MEKLRTIRLYGELGVLFGRVHRLAVETPAEAIKALTVILSGFERYLITSKQRGITFAVFNGKTNLHCEEMISAGGDQDIRIAPMIIGSKRGGVFQTILGVAMIGVASVMSGGLGSAFAAKGIWGFTAWMGASMALGGVMQMLAPQPPGLKMRESPDNKPSYAFGGPVNTTSHGNPVPILYGRRRVGGAIISAGIYTEDKR